MAVAPATAVDFLELVRKSGVVPAAILDSLPNLPPEPTACAAALIAKGHITKFQAKLLLSGRYKGFKLGHYIVREQIGQGGMGAVYLGQHETLGRKVALKVLTPPKDSKDGQLALERFLREARAAAALDHPNIVRLFDVGQSNGTHFIVMEYVEGQTLDQLLDKAGPIAPSRAVGYIAQAAAGLQHAYEQGFVHRDIKPGNLMITKDGTVKILDMGLARPADDNEKLTEVLDKGAIVGTADFISPEQAVNGKVDIRSDIYSLGATFFALVTGAPPFQGNTTQKLIQHQMKEAPTLAALDRTFPGKLSKVVAKMLEKKPADRYQTPAELISALAEWLPRDGSRKVVAGLSVNPSSAELQNTLSEVESATQRFDTKTRLGALKPRQKQILIWSGLAVGVVLLGGLIGWAFSGSGKKDPPPIAGQNPTQDPKPKAPDKDVKPKATEQKKDTPSTPSQPPSPKLPPDVFVSLPMSTMVPFHQTLGTFMDGTVRRLKVINESGPGLPRQWYRWFDQLGMEAEVFVEETAEGKVLGLRGTSGEGVFFVSTPEFKAPPRGVVRIMLTYATDAGSPGAEIRFRQMKPSERTTSAVKLPATNGAWKTLETEFNLSGAESGLFELAITKTGDVAGLRIMAFEVTLPKSQ